MHKRFEVYGYGRKTGRRRHRFYNAVDEEDAIHQAAKDETIVESVTEIKPPLINLKVLRKLKPYGITELDFESMREKLEKRFGREPSPSDVEWGLYNIAITKTQGHDDLSRLYWDMAFMLYCEGKDCSELRKRSAIESLLHMKGEAKFMTAGTVKGIRVLGSCTPSNELGKFVLSLNDAVKDCPIPCNNCDREKGAAQSWCACDFIFELDE